MRKEELSKEEENKTFSELAEEKKEKKKSKDKESNKEKDNETPTVDKEIVVEEKKDSKEDEYLNLARRTQADFDNYRKKTAEMLKVAKEDGIVLAVSKIITAYDSLKNALKQINDEKVNAGIQLIINDIKGSLDSLHIKEIISKGEKYNPKYHNVVATLKTEGVEDDVILEELQTCFTLNDRVIRYGQVVINKN